MADEAKDLAGDVIENMPQPDAQLTHTTPATPSDGNPSPLAPLVATDAAGEKNDPDPAPAGDGLEIAADGQPVRNKDGTFRRKRGRKPGPQQDTLRPAAPSRLRLPVETGPAGGEIPAGSDVSLSTTPPPPPPDYSAMGAVAASVVFTAGIAVFGEDGKPIIDKAAGQDEPENMRGAFAEYFRATGTQDFPPGAILAVALLAYAGQRVTRPTVRARMVAAWLWFRGLLPA